MCPNAALLKLRHLAELLAQLVATNVSLYTSLEEPQSDGLRRLQDQGIRPREVAELLGVGGVEMADYRWDDRVGTHACTLSNDLDDCAPRCWRSTSRSPVS